MFLRSIQHTQNIRAQGKHSNQKEAKKEDCILFGNKFRKMTI